MERRLTRDDVRTLLALAVEQAGGQRAWAQHAGVSPAWVNSILRQHRKPGPAVLRALGLRHVSYYTKAAHGN